MVADTTNNAAAAQTPPPQSADIDAQAHGAARKSEKAARQTFGGWLTLLLMLCAFVGVFASGDAGQMIMSGREWGFLWAVMVLACIAMAVRVRFDRPMPFALSADVGRKAILYFAQVNPKRGECSSATKKKKKSSPTIGERINGACRGVVALLEEGVATFLAYFVANDIFLSGEANSDLPNGEFIIWLALVILLGHPVTVVAAHVRAGFGTTEKDALRSHMTEGGVVHCVLIALLVAIPFLIRIAGYAVLFYFAHLLTPIIL